MSKLKVSLFVTALVVSGLVILPGKVAADWLIDSTGKLGFTASVLGDNLDEPEQEDEDEDEPEQEDKDDDGKMEQEQEKHQEQVEVKYEVNQEGDKTVIKTHTKNEATGEEVESETELEKGEILKIELQSQKEVKNGTGSGEQEQEQEREQEREHTELKIENGGDDTSLVVKNGTSVRTGFPLSVGANNELVVTTSRGLKVVAILPDEAVAALLGSGVLTSYVDSLGDGQAGELLEVDGDPVYVVEGDKQEKLLGVIPVKFHKKVTLSAATGEVTNVEQTFLTRLVDAVSF